MRLNTTDSDATQPQRDYVQVLQKRLRLPDTLLDNYCVTRFGRPFTQLSRREVSAVIDELKAWDALPAELERAKGQLDLL